MTTTRHRSARVAFGRAPKASWARFGALALCLCAPATASAMEPTQGISGNGALSIDGDHAAVVDRGHVKVYERTHGVWLERQRIEVQGGQVPASAVVVHGDTLLVAVEGSAVHTFERRVDGAFVLDHSFGGYCCSLPGFGKAVALSEQRLLIVHDEGAVSYARHEDGWQPDGYKVDVPSGFTDIAIDGRTTVVSTWLGVRVFEGDELEAEIAPASTMGAQRFGHAVEIAGNTLAVGSPWELDGGAVHIYERTPEGWHHLQRLAGDSRSFGANVALGDELLVVGEKWDDAPVDAAYAFARSGERWEPVATLRGFETLSIDSELAVSERTALIASPTRATYVFDIPALEPDTGAAEQDELEGAPAPVDGGPNDLVVANGCTMAPPTGDDGWWTLGVVGLLWRRRSWARVSS